MAPRRVCLAFLPLAFLVFEAASARQLSKAPLSSILSPDGDIIDCMDITKQPAFDHPLLKNHTIQMRPYYHPRGLYDETNNVTNSFAQIWHQNGMCPENTIPIRRTEQEDILTASSIKKNAKTMARIDPRSISIEDPDDAKNHLHAAASSLGQDKYYGTQAAFNVWQPTLETTDDFSLAQLWIVSGSGNDLNTIEVGWEVFPYLYKDSNTRLFIFWTKDGYKTGCYNLCKGFVQTNNQIAIGGSILPLSPVSTYDGAQYDFTILVWKDQKGGNWWLQVGSYVLGYWPSSIFTTLVDSASIVQWGGEVYSPNAGQTSTQMGSGHFPEEGPGKSSYIKNILLVDSSNSLRSPNDVALLAEKRNCYRAQKGTASDSGTYIFYGGPGKNDPNC